MSGSNLCSSKKSPGGRGRGAQDIRMLAEQIRFGEKSCCPFSEI
jgi:hypothetical protein